MAEDSTQQPPESIVSKELQSTLPQNAQGAPEQESNIPIPPEMLKGMPPAVRASFEQFFMQVRSGSISDPIRQKITEKHISEIIQQSGDEERRSFELKKHERWMLILVLCLVLLFVFALHVLFKSNPTAVQPVLTHLIAFAGGIGMGIAARRK